MGVALLVLVRLSLFQLQVSLQSSNCKLSAHVGVALLVVVRLSLFQLQVYALSAARSAFPESRTLEFDCGWSFFESRRGQKKGMKHEVY